MESSRNILLVGGNSGIGAAVLGRLKASGHTVTVAARQHEAIPGAQHFDATTPPASLVLPEILHGVVYCPGTVNLKPFHRLTKEDFLRDLEVNLFGAIEVLQLAYPAMKKADNASVVLFSTVAVGLGLPMHAGIATAKGAVEGLARSLAAEWAPRIRVNVIAPSLTKTPLVEPLISSLEREKASSDRHPLKRIGDAEETAAWVAHLLSPASGFMTGQILHLDGGMSSVRTL